MRHRIFSADSVVPDSELVVRGEEMHHAARVVRVHPGEEVEVFDGRGGAASARVLEVTKDEVRLHVGALIPSREAPVAIDLAMAIIALDKFELVLQKATELGVRSIIPLITDRVEVRPERYRGKSERWQKIVFEAVKQSGRAAIPVVEEPSRFGEVMARPGVLILFDADAEPEPLPKSVSTLTAAVGPEGGWTDDELARARARGVLFQRLGPRRLRAETAAIAGVATLAARLGYI